MTISAFLVLPWFIIHVALCHCGEKHIHQTPRDLEERDEDFCLGSDCWPSKRAFVESGSRCAHEDPSEDEAREQQRIVMEWAAKKSISPGRNALVGLPMVTIPTYYHIITDGDGINGTLTPQAIHDSHQVIVDAFAPHGFTFSNQGTTITNNSDWFNLTIGSDEEYNMTSALRTGGAETLNVYFVRPPREVLGWATLPLLYPLFPTTDGVFINYLSVPGGPLHPYNEGDTLTHEIGHWLGLFHTFTFGCVVDDLVLDTPPEGEPAYGCPVGRDTCPFSLGLDPIDNYMNYVDDACMNKFTSGQALRMQAMWYTFRDPGISVSSGCSLSISNISNLLSGGIFSCLWSLLTGAINFFLSLIPFI